MSSVTLSSSAADRHQQLMISLGPGKLWTNYPRISCVCESKHRREIIDIKWRGFPLAHQWQLVQVISCEGYKAPSRDKEKVRRPCLEKPFWAPSAAKFWTIIFGLTPVSTTTLTRKARSVKKSCFSRRNYFLHTWPWPTMSKHTTEPLGQREFGMYRWV